MPPNPERERARALRYLLAVAAPALAAVVAHLLQPIIHPSVSPPLPAGGCGGCALWGVGPGAVVSLAECGCARVLVFPTQHTITSELRATSRSYLSFWWWPRSSPGWVVQSATTAGSRFTPTRRSARARSAVDAHGGQVRVQSTRGKGSQFSFTLPTAS